MSDSNSEKNDDKVETISLNTSSSIERGIQYSDVLDMLSFTFLIYDYGKIINYTPGDTLQNFISKLHENDKELDDKINLSPIKQKALKQLQNNSHDVEIKEFISDIDTDLQVGITMSRKNKRISIIFRGSESAYDWYYDLKFLKTCIKREENVYVHNGFYTQLTTNKNDELLTEKVKKLLEDNPDYSVYVSGHSLGGALCTLYGYLLSHEISQQVTIVSFASPRVGNNGWKKSFDAKENLHHYRITNCNDIVTAFPNILYRHVGENIRLENNKSPTFLYDYSYSWWDYCLFKCYSITDHFCDEYYKHLVASNW